MNEFIINGNFWFGMFSTLFYSGIRCDYDDTDIFVIIFIWFVILNYWIELIDIFDYEPAHDCGIVLLCNACDMIQECLQMTSRYFFFQEISIPYLCHAKWTKLICVQRHTYQKVNVINQYVFMILTYPLQANQLNSINCHKRPGRNDKRQTVKDTIALPARTNDSIVYTQSKMRGLGLFRAAWGVDLQYFSLANKFSKIYDRLFHNLSDCLRPNLAKICPTFS